MKVAIWGATGATGSELLRLCLEESGIDEVRIFGRRKIGLENAKATEVTVENFLNADSYANSLEDIDVAFWCLGVSQSVVGDEKRYREITFDYAMVAAKALISSSAAAQFHFVSGMGAKKTARPMWARVKGETEEALADMGFSRLVIWRPGYIHVPGGRKDPAFWERAWELLSPLFRLVPGLVNPVADIARAMLREALKGRTGEGGVIECGSREIRKLGSGRASLGSE